MFRFYFSNRRAELKREERPGGKKAWETKKEEFEGSHMLLINSLKVEKDGENYLLRSLRVTNTVCWVVFPPNTDTMEKVIRHVEKSLYGQEGVTLKTKTKQWNSHLTSVMKNKSNTYNYTRFKFNTISLSFNSVVNIALLTLIDFVFSAII